jgi:hypothetical protein
VEKTYLIIFNRDFPLLHINLINLKGIYNEVDSLYFKAVLKAQMGKLDMKHLFSYADKFGVLKVLRELIEELDRENHDYRPGLI